MSDSLFDSIDSGNVLFTMEEVKEILPHLYELIPKWSRLGVFATRWPSSPICQDLKLMSVHDLCALVVLFLIFKCGVDGRELLAALSDYPKTYYCEQLSWESALFLATGGWKGQEISRFIEACDFNVKVHISLGFQGEENRILLPAGIRGSFPCIRSRYNPRCPPHSSVYKGPNPERVRGFPGVFVQIRKQGLG